MIILNTKQCRSVSGARAQDWTGFILDEGIVTNLYLQQGETISIKDGNLSYTLG